MKLKLKLNRAVAGYILAGIAMLFLFLYLRFPGQAVADYVRTLTAARYPQLLFSVAAVRPSVPPGLVLAEITVAPRERPEAVLRVDHLDVRPGGLALLNGRYTILTAAKGYGGEAEGRVDFTRRFSFQGPLKATAAVWDIRVDKCAWLRDALARPITGTLKGSATFSGTAEALKNGTGNIDFTLTNGTYPLQEKFLGFDKIDFSRVEAKVGFKNGALKVAVLTLQGDKLRCSLKGNILLADVLQESRIELNGTFEIPAQGSKRVMIAIGGTLANPVMRFL
jgi:type II secretion system protein N